MLFFRNQNLKYDAYNGNNMILTIEILELVFLSWTKLIFFLFL